MTASPRLAPRLDFRFAMRAAAPPERVFPLLCPVREHDWVDGWHATVIHSASGVAEEGCLFATDSAEGRALWVVDRYEPGARIGFVRFVAGVLLETLTIDLVPDGDATALRWHRVVTALCDEVAATLDRRRAEYESRHPALEAALNHYLATGQCLRRAAA